MRQHRTVAVLDSQTATRFARVLRTALECMRSKNAYRIVLLIVVVWAAASPFIWRHNLEAAFGSLPWDVSAIPLAIAFLAVVCAAPLWQLN